MRVFDSREEAEEYCSWHIGGKSCIDKSGDKYCIKVVADRGEYSSGEYVRVARDLLYPAQVIEALKAAKTEDEALRIMADARHGKYQKG